MTPLDPVLLVLAGILAVAFLYSSVGHAGASGYIAVLSLAGLAPAEIRPAALALNILVATIATVQYARAGHFRGSLFWPFALASVPAAYLGGRLVLPVAAFNVLVGCVLLFSATRFFRKPEDPLVVNPPRAATGLATGAALGLLSGMTGTGGGIFLTPLMLLAGWAKTKTAAAVTAPFILLNSIAGLLGFLSTGGNVPRDTAWMAAVAVVGGTAGAWFGSRRFPVRTIRLLLAAVLLVAGLKLVLGR